MMRRPEFDDPLRPTPLRVPQRGAVSQYPLVFDTRSQAWRIHNPESYEAQDPDRPLNQPPRQRAASSCNLLELYERLKRCFILYQTEWDPVDAKPQVLFLKHQFIEPRRGWRLKNTTTGVEYKVAAVSRTKQDPSFFTGHVVLEVGQTMPKYGDILEWADPYGAVDGESKLVKLIADDETQTILEPRESSGDLAGSEKKPFVPIVGYEFLRFEPGSVDGRAFGTTKVNKPTFRSDFYDPLAPNEAVEVRGWWKELLLEFRCYALNGGAADRMSLWVANFLAMYTGVLKLLGVQEMFYWQHSLPKTEGRVVRNFSIRGVQYYFRLEELTVTRLPRNRSFDIALSVIDAETGLVEGETSRTAVSEWDATHDTSGQYVYGDLVVGDDY